jgi:L-serine dehydratase
MLGYDSIKELVDLATGTGKSISDVIIEDQCAELEMEPDEILEKMRYRLKVMKEASISGMKKDMKSVSGLSGGDAYKMMTGINEGKTFGGKVLNKAAVKALSISETNACSGRVVAAPTAGSCGIIPAVLLTAEEELDISEERVVRSLFTSAAIGLVISKRASLSGAEGGCQAECGSASAMAAGALAELLGGTPETISHASALALKNTLGLVCDPIAGLVEVPCVKRNAVCAAIAIMAADMAISGIKSVIPADEVIDAMKSIGNLMAAALKETAEGGLAVTPTGCRLSMQILNSFHD